MGGATLIHRGPFCDSILAAAIMVFVIYFSEGLTERTFFVQKIPDSIG